MTNDSQWAHHVSVFWQQDKLKINLTDDKHLVIKKGQSLGPYPSHCRSFFPGFASNGFTADAPATYPPAHFSLFFSFSKVSTFPTKRHLHSSPSLWSSSSFQPTQLLYYVLFTIIIILFFYNYNYINNLRIIIFLILLKDIKFKSYIFKLKINMSWNQDHYKNLLMSEIKWKKCLFILARLISKSLKSTISNPTW